MAALVSLVTPITEAGVASHALIDHDIHSQMEKSMYRIEKPMHKGSHHVQNKQQYKKQSTTTNTIMQPKKYRSIKMAKHSKLSDVLERVNDNHVVPIESKQNP
jgi:hypothetical protein